MPLSWDPEFAQLAGPALAGVIDAEEPPVGDIETRRSQLENIFTELAKGLPPLEGVETTEFTIKTYDGVDIKVYRYRGAGVEFNEPTSAILNIHGGGMVAGNCELFNRNLKTLAKSLGVQFFDVEYRRAPEMKHDSLVKDAYAALLWMHENAHKLMINASRIGVLGFSSGGGIAAGLALYARDQKLQPPLAKAVLVYPMLDYKTNKPATEGLARFLYWKPESNITGWSALLGDTYKTGEVSPYASVSHAADLSGLPPTYIDVGQMDLFCKENIEYVQRLVAADVNVDFHLYPGVFHAFEPFAPTSSVTAQAMSNRIKAITSF